MMRNFMTVGAATLMAGLFLTACTNTSNQHEIFPQWERDSRRNWLKIIAN